MSSDFLFSDFFPSLAREIASLRDVREVYTEQKSSSLGEAAPDVIYEFVLSCLDSEDAFFPQGEDSGFYPLEWGKRLYAFLCVAVEDAEKMQSDITGELREISRLFCISFLSKACEHCQWKMPEGILFTPRFLEDFPLEGEKEAPVLIKKALQLLSQAYSLEIKKEADCELLFGEAVKQIELFMQHALYPCPECRDFTVCCVKKKEQRGG